jgi:hypothetical protein
MVERSGSIALRGNTAVAAAAATTNTNTTHHPPAASYGPALAEKSIAACRVVLDGNRNRLSAYLGCAGLS